jgi:hypothetical protein
MKKLLSLAFIILYICSNLHAQTTFQRTYDVDGGRVLKTMDGGYIVISSGSKMSGSKSDAYLLKLNFKGAVEWTKAYYTAYDEGFSFIKQNSDSSFIISGLSNIDVSGAQRGFLLKTDSKGDTIWKKTYGLLEKPLIINSFEQTNDGGFILAGTYENAGNLTRIDNIGNILWTKNFGGTNSNEYCKINTVHQTLDGGYIACGFISQDGNSFIVKVNSAGTVIWQKTFGYQYKNAVSIFETQLGHFVFGGAYWNGVGDNGGYIIKLNQNGNLIWNKIYKDLNPEQNDVITNISQTKNGNYISVLSKPSNIYSELTFIKTDSAGNFILCKKYKPTDFAYVQGGQIFEDSDSGFVIVGSNSSNQLYVIKTNSVGISNCFETSLLLAPTSPTCNESTPTISYSSIISYQNGISFQVDTTTVKSTILCSTSVGMDNNPFIYENISVFPNPTNGLINIDLGNLPINQSYIIYDQFGRVILNGITNLKVNQIDISFMNCGLYYLELGGTKQFKIIKF